MWLYKLSQTVHYNAITVHMIPSANDLRKQLYFGLALVYIRPALLFTLWHHSTIWTMHSRIWDKCCSGRSIVSHLSFKTENYSRTAPLLDQELHHMNWQHPCDETWIHLCLVNRVYVRSTLYTMHTCYISGKRTQAALKYSEDYLTHKQFQMCAWVIVTKIIHNCSFKAFCYNKYKKEEGADRYTDIQSE